MTRRILIELALFVFPSVCYFLFLLATGEKRSVATWPLRSLGTAGAVLAVGALVVVALSSPSDRGLCYQAGRYVDGRAIAGKKMPCDAVSRPPAQGATAIVEE